MIKRLRKYIWSFIIAVAVILSISTTAFAIGNPDAIDFGTGTVRIYNIYENVLEDDDMLIVVEGYVYYAVPPTDYTAGEAFLFEIINTAGTATIESVPLNQYGDRPLSIYLSAARVTELGLTTETAYGLRITPNPLLLDTEFGGGGAIEGTNQITVFLAPADYIDQELGADSSPPNDNLLRNGLIDIADNMEKEDTPTDDYLAEVQGYRYLTVVGGNFFIEAIPGIVNICPVAFQAGLEALSSPPPESTGTYALTLTPAQKWGTTVANGLTNLGLYMGINQALAGSLVLFVMAIALAIYVYAKTQSGVSVLLIVAAVPFIGAYLGLMPIALAFIVVIILAALLGYYFFSRGAL